jgi:hypothetical protein
LSFSRRRAALGHCRKRSRLFGFDEYRVFLRERLRDGSTFQPPVPDFPLLDTLSDLDILGYVIENRFHL